MRKSKHFAYAAIAFAIGSTGFLVANYLILGCCLGALATVYIVLACRAYGREVQDA